MNPRIVSAVNNKFPSGRGIVTDIELAADHSLKIKTWVLPDEGIENFMFDFSEQWIHLVSDNKEAWEARKKQREQNDCKDILTIDPQRADTLIIENPMLAQFFMGVFQQAAQEIKRPTWKLLDELIKQVSTGQNTIRITQSPSDNFNLNECMVLRTFFRTHPEFKIEFAKQVNNASSSSVMLSGGPQGAVFTLKSPNNALMEGLFNAQQHLGTFHRPVKALIQMLLSGEYDLSQGSPFARREDCLTKTEMQQLIDFFTQTHPELELLCPEPIYTFLGHFYVNFDKKGEALREKLQQALEIIEVEELGQIKNAAHVF